MASRPEIELEADILITDPFWFDQQTFMNWVSGSSVDEVAYQRCKLLYSVQNSDGNFVSDHNKLISLIERDVRDQLLEHYLRNPHLLSEQIMIQFPGSVMKDMMEYYYDIDGRVLREFLGKKLTTKLRKDLDEISEVTNVTLQSCQRQFDNMKRLFNFFYDRNFQGDIYQMIYSHFSLSGSLSRTYVCGLFLLFNRFQVQSSRKRSLPLQWRDFENIAWLMIKQWCKGPDDCMMELDPIFCSTLRDLKTALHSERERLDEYSAHVQESLVGVMNEPKLRYLARQFRHFTRVLLTVGAGLITPKELRDFFEDIFDKFVEPFSSAGFNSADVEQIIEAMISKLDKLSINLHPGTSVLSPVDTVSSETMSSLESCIWERFLRVVGLTVSRMMTYGENGQTIDNEEKQ